MKQAREGTNRRMAEDKGGSGREEAFKMTERYNPFTGKGKLVVKDTPYKTLKRYTNEPKKAATIRVAIPLRG